MLMCFIKVQCKFSQTYPPTTTTAFFQLPWDSLALSFPCQSKIFSGMLIVFSQASYLGLRSEMIL